MIMLLNHVYVPDNWSSLGLKMIRKVAGVEKSAENQETYISSKISDGVRRNERCLGGREERRVVYDGWRRLSRKWLLSI